jgi:outer membrane immunogenic protein
MLILILVLKRVGPGIATILVLASFAPAQDDGRFDASIGYIGVFSKTSSAPLGNTTLKPTTSGGILASFRYHFNHTHGIEVNFGHTSNTQVFTVPPDTFRVTTGITEYSGAYVLRPFHSRKIDPFLFAGGGTLRFNPSNQYIDGFLSSFGASSQRALAVLYGGGVDYRVWRALAVRVQYRGLIYKTPDFRVPALFTGVYGHMAEPSAGIVIKF